MAEHLHIVSFDIPFPADYGGIIDVYYKARAIAKLGIKIHMHCFAYGRPIADELNSFCHEVHYYERNMNKTLLAHPLPFIIVSRQNSQLLSRLKADHHPILFEGKHCCYYLDHSDLKERKKFVRTHNVESDYYAGLAKHAGFFRRLYFNSESRKLDRFKMHLKSADALFSISPNDAEKFSAFGETIFIPPFHANDRVNTLFEKEDFALYHGNLSISENEEAAMWLLEVFKGLDKKLLIAGGGASGLLTYRCSKLENVELVGPEGLLDLIKKAKVNILPTFQPTGMKLKLLFSLFNGGHVLVNHPMVQGTGLEPLCQVAESVESMREELDRIWSSEFTKADACSRERVLLENFSNPDNALKIINRIFN